MNNTRPDHLQAIWEITKLIQDENQLESALAGSLEIVVNTLKCEEGSVWLTDKAESRLYALTNFGKTDITGFSVALGA